MATLSPARPLGRERLFFTGMAVLILCVVFAGFAPSYFLRGVVDAPPGLKPMTPLVHAHALAFTSWIVLFVAQTSLLAAGRRDVHRRLGTIGAALATLIVALGVAAAIHGMLRAAGPPNIPPAQFLAIPLFDMLIFATVVTLGIRARRDAATHKRFMLIATITMLGAAFGRMMWLPAAVLGLPGFMLAQLSLLGVLVVYDFATFGKLHRATLAGGGLLAISMPLRLALMTTPTWAGFAATVAARFGG